MSNKAFIKLVEEGKYNLEFNNGTIDLSKEILLELLKSGYIFENCFLDSDNIILSPFTWSNHMETMNRLYGTSDTVLINSDYICTCGKCGSKVNKQSTSSFQSRDLYNLDYDVFAFRTKPCINCKNYDSLIKFNNLNLDYKVIGLAKDNNKCSDIYDFIHNYYIGVTTRSIKGHEINRSKHACIRFYITNGSYCKFLTKATVDKIINNGRITTSSLKDNEASCCYNIAESILEYYLSAIIGVDYVRHTMYAFEYSFSANIDFAFSYNGNKYIIQVNDVSHINSDKFIRDTSLVNDCEKYGINIIHLNELNLPFISNYVGIVNLGSKDLIDINEAFKVLSSLINFTGNTEISESELSFIKVYSVFMSNWGYAFYDLILYNVDSSLVNLTKNFLTNLDFLKSTNFTVDFIKILNLAYYNDVIVNKVKQAISLNKVSVDCQDCTLENTTTEESIMTDESSQVADTVNYCELYNNSLTKIEKLNRQIYFLGKDLEYYKSKCSELEEILELA